MEPKGSPQVEPRPTICVIRISCPSAALLVEGEMSTGQGYEYSSRNDSLQEAFGALESSIDAKSLNSLVRRWWRKPPPHHRPLQNFLFLLHPSKL